MSTFKFRDSKSFEELITRRRNQGFEEYAILIGGKRVDKAVFLDTSWETLEELADAVVYIRFEIAKVGTMDLKAECRRLRSLEKAILQLGRELFDYRERMSIKAPDLITLGWDGLLNSTDKEAQELVIASSQSRCKENT